MSILKHPVHFAGAVVAGHKLSSIADMIYQFQYTAKRLPIIDDKYDIAISFRHFDIDVFFVMENMKAKRKCFWVHGVQPMEKKEVDVLKPIYEGYNTIVPVSVSAKDNITSYFPTIAPKCKVAYCIVDPEEIISKSEIGEKFKKDDDAITLFTIGRLGYEKGIDIAVEAAEIMRDAHVNFRWYVAGEGKERTVLEKMIEVKGLKGNFILLGNVTNPYGFLSSCDIYVQPSRLESYGLAVNEAKILRKPIVCSNIPAGREQISDGYNGLLSILSPVGISDCVVRLINDKELANKLTHNLASSDYGHLESAGFFVDLVLQD